MNEVQISPLAKRLAEENSIDWRKIRGTGPESRVIERDILTYLARIMSGEADLPAEPDKSEPSGPSSMPAALPGNVANFAAASAGLAKEGVDLSALIGGIVPIAATSINEAPLPPLDFGTLEVAPVPAIAPALFEPVHVMPEPMVMPVIPVPVIAAAPVLDEPVFEMDFDDDEPAIVFENPTMLDVPYAVEVVTDSGDELPVWTAPVVVPASIPEPAMPVFIAPEPVAPVFIAPEPVAPVFIAPEPVMPVFVAPEPVVPVFVAPEPVVPAWTAPVEPIWAMPEPVVVVPPVEVAPVFIAEPVIPPAPAWTAPEPIFIAPEPVAPIWTAPEPVLPPAPVWTAPESLYVAPPVLVPEIAPEPVYVAPEPVVPVVLPEVVPAMVVPEVVAVPAPGFQAPSTGVLTDYFQLFVARREINTKPLEDICVQLSASLNNREITNELFLARAVARAVHLLDLEKFSLARLEGMGLQAYQVDGLQHSFLEALQGLSRASHGVSEGLLVVDASRLGVDDLVLPGKVGVLALGNKGKLTLSGNLSPLKSTEFLQKIAELLENPVGLVV